MNEEKVVLSYILQNFTIKAMQKQEELRPMSEIILRPENGIRVRISTRKWHHYPEHSKGRCYFSSIYQL